MSGLGNYQGESYSIVTKRPIPQDHITIVYIHVHNRHSKYIK